MNESIKWKLVPMEPDEAQLKTARIWLTHLHLKRETDRMNAMREFYKAAVAASPEPEGETPETDSQIMYRCASYQEVVPAEFAKKLERQRNALLAKLKG
jgi:hypothetical protein